MRRNVWWFAVGNTAGNRVLAIRREDKNVWERRVPLAPDQVAALLERGEVKKVLVQPSKIRCFRDEEYAEVGAKISEDLSEAGTIIAVKEVPAHLLIPDRTYLFFSHTIKAQPHNMPLLDAMLDNNIRLIDYERILNEDGRVVKFGPYAGYAGTIDTLNALGQALLMKGYATPFLNVSLAKEYRSLETARADLLILGNNIRKFGLPREIGPLTFAVTGSGAVSLASQEMLHHLPCKYVSPEDLPKLWKSKSYDNRFIYVVVVTAKDMVAPKDPRKIFDKLEYYRHPENYKPTYHQNIAPYVHVLLNGMYWEPKYPRLLTIQQAKALQAENRFPLLCLGDISCDIGGSVEFFVKATTIQNPFYVYRLKQEEVQSIQEYNGDGVIVLGVDHLPAEFPMEASRDFGSKLYPLLEKVCKSPLTDDLVDQRSQLGEELYSGLVTSQGRLTPNFEYIAKLRREYEAIHIKPTVEGRREVLVVGAGMTAGPCVAELLKDQRNWVTVADMSPENLETISQEFAKGSEHLSTMRTNAGLMEKALVRQIEKSDVVVSLLPATMHPIVAKQTIAAKKPLVTASYTSPAMRAMEQEAVANGTYIVNEIGLDPGIDIMTTAKMFHEIRSEGGIIKSYVSLCGALPSPENSDCPLGYKFSWSPRGVLTAATRPTKFRVGNEWLEVPGKYLYYLIQPLTHYSGVDLHWIPNGDATPYSSLFSLPDDTTKHIVRGTLRYRTFAPSVCCFAALGLLDESNIVEQLKAESTKPITWIDLMTLLLDRLGAPKQDGVPPRYRLRQFLTHAVSATYQEVQELQAFKILQKEEIMGSQPQSRMARNIPEEVAAAVADMEKLGLLGFTNVPKTANGSAIDSLCQQLLKGYMNYKPHERDFVLMIHRIKAHFPATGKTRVITATLSQRGEDTFRSATAKTVGIPVGITAQLALDGAFDRQKGLLFPTMPEIYNPNIQKLHAQGIWMHETVTEE